MERGGTSTDPFASLKHLAKRQFIIGSGRVINSPSIFLDQLNNERGQVTYINNLNRRFRRVWRDHVAPAFDPHWPIGEAIGWIIWSNDQSGTNNERSLTVDVLRGFFAQRLQRAVGLASDFFHRFILQFPNRIGLIDADIFEVWIHR